MGVQVERIAKLKRIIYRFNKYFHFGKETKQRFYDKRIIGSMQSSTYNNRKMTNKKTDDAKIKPKDKNKHKIKPDLSEAFKGSVIKAIIANVLVNVLDGEQR